MQVMHCEKCNFDACFRCCALVLRQAPLSLPHLHTHTLQLARITVDGNSDDEQEVFCDGCVQPLAVGTHILRCEKCDFDVCFLCSALSWDVGDVPLALPLARAVDSASTHTKSSNGCPTSKWAGSASTHKITSEGCLTSEGGGNSKPPFTVATTVVAELQQRLAAAQRQFRSLQTQMCRDHDVDIILVHGEVPEHYVNPAWLQTCSNQHPRTNTH
jgi:hypothetical protein